nr:hypothetical protein [Brevibacillus laterosporus]
MKQIDRLTRVFKLEDNFFYGLIYGEIFRDTAGVSLSKAIEFIKACSQNAKGIAHCSKVVELFLEVIDTKNLPNALVLAETLFGYGFLSEAASVYYSIANIERKISERLAVCWHRIFLIERDRDMKKKGVEALHKLQTVLDDLPTEYPAQKNGSIELINLQLDGYYRIVTWFNVTKEWEELILISEAYYKEAKDAQDLKHQGEALLYQAAGLIGVGKLRKAVGFLRECHTLGEYYRWAAMSNEKLIEVMEGKVEAISEFIRLVVEKDQDHEIITVAPHAIRTLLSKGQLDGIRVFLDKYSAVFESVSSKKDKYNKSQFYNFQVVRLQYYLAKKQYKEAFNDVLEVVRTALEFGDISTYQEMSAILFEHKAILGEDVEHRYMNILKRGETG